MAYTYYFLDRVLDAQYADINSTGVATMNNRFRETVAYDVRGNITSINRNGMYKTTPTATCYTLGAIDNLTFSYFTDKNRLQKVTDGVTVTAANAIGWTNTAAAPGTAEFGYDNNGNMTSDPYKGLTINYNSYLNLPSKFTFTGNKTIDILYDASGRKLRKTVSNNGVPVTVQDYADGIEYRNNAIESIFHAEGRVFYWTASNVQYSRYEYAIRDHLGSTRLMFTDKNNDGVITVNTASPTLNELLQENHFYPYGMRQSGVWIDDEMPDNRYQYNGYELNTDWGLNLQDYGARWYDPALARFPSLDPLGAMTPSFNGYSYAGLNPVSNIDLMGLSSTKAVAQDSIPPLQNLGGAYIQGQLDQFGSTVKQAGRDLLEMALSPGYNSGITNGLSQTSKFYFAPFDQKVNMTLHFAFPGLEKIDKTYAIFGTWEDGHYTEACYQAGQLVMETKVEITAAVLPEVKIGGSKVVIPTVDEEVASSALVPYYPANGGAMGEWIDDVAQKGAIYDRYGGTGGRYASPVGTPIEMRALPSGTNPENYFQFEVMKPFPIKRSVVAPAYGKWGGGTQIVTPIDINYLNDFGIIKILK